MASPTMGVGRWGPSNMPTVMDLSLSAEPW